MRIADLRHTVQIQEPQRTPDDGGGATVTWTTMGLVWAKVVPVTGREDVQSHKRRSVISHNVIVRWRPNLSPLHRLVWTDRVLEILSVYDPGGRRRWLVCACLERVNP